MSASGVKRWVFQLEVRERIVEPLEALGSLAEALARVVTAAGGQPIWQLTQGVTAHPSVPHQFYFAAVTHYPPGGSIRLGCVAVNTPVAYADFQGTATLLRLNFEDNLGWSVPYARVPPDRAVQQLYLEPGLGYAETVFDTTVTTAQKLLQGRYGDQAVVGMEQ